MSGLRHASRCFATLLLLPFLAACGGGGGGNAAGPATPPGPTADTQAPGAPSGLSADAVTARSLSFTWQASTDNVGVTGYDVIKDGVVVATTTAEVRAHAEAALSSNTRSTFTVRARDAAGNLSAASAPLVITTTDRPLLAGDPGVASWRSAPTAAAYYIDANHGNDTNDGRSSATAWRTLDRLHRQSLGPGDVVRLARGSVWKNQNLYFDTATVASGSAGSPVIIEAFGTGEPPTIAEPRALWDKTKDFAAVYVGSQVHHLTILDLRIQDVADNFGVTVNAGSKGVVLGNLEILRCSTGIGLAGSDHKVLSCYLHDMNRGNGGIGIAFMGSNLEFAWNRLSHCFVTRPSDGIKDGAPFEYYGRSFTSTGVETFDLSDNIQIHHNLVDSCLNFIEAYGNATRMVIAFNLYVNSPVNPLVIHFDDSEHSTWTHECTYELIVENNTFVPTVENNPGGWGAYGLLVDSNHMPDPNKSHVAIRNNLLVTNYTALSWINPLGSSLVHDHNLFFFIDNGRLCTTPGVWVQDATEIIADPRFRDAARQDYRLTASSPAIGKGAPALYDVDLAGNPIPANAPSDIGAFRYVP